MAFGHFSFGLSSQFHGHGSWLVCEVALISNVMLGEIVEGQSQLARPIAVAQSNVTSLGIILDMKMVWATKCHWSMTNFWEHVVNESHS